MEPKKNPRYDVHQKRNLIFNFSLALSLLIVISAFRIAVPYDEGKDLPPEPYEPESILYSAPPTVHRDPSPPQAVPEKRQPLDLTRLKIAEAHSDVSPDPLIDQYKEIPVNPFSGIEIPVEIPEDTTTFIVVEHKPEPVGGMTAFYKTLAENLKYPKKAIRFETTGTVFVEFVVEKSGMPGRIKVLRGIGNGCDEEAMRVISLTRWNPGRQRGKPVKVKMVLPVAFKLEN